MASERILIIDDGKESRDFIADYILLPNDYTPLMARDGIEGLEMLRAHHPDLILLDLQMPRMNGIEFLQHLHESGDPTPVILMTFYGSEEIAVGVYRMGVRDYVKKPFTIDEMLLAIQRTLDEVALKRQAQELTERLTSANRELQQRVHELNVLYKVGKQVTSIVTMPELLPRIVEAAAKLTYGEDCRLYLTEGEALICRAVKQQTQREGTLVAQATTDALLMSVMQQGTPRVYTPEQARPGGVVSVIAVPLIIRGVVSGVLAVVNRTPNAPVFGAHEMALVSALADYAAIAVDNAYNIAELSDSKDRETRRVRRTFEQFVAPTVVERALQTDQGVVQPGGRRQEVSILFADLRGYTAFSETLAPEAVLTQLNHYLSLAANIILSCGGTLDKYLGDGLMALFNAPEPTENHAHAAARAALMLIEASEQLAAAGAQPLAFSVGVSTGDAVVGYVGTDAAINYTAIGDVVNRAKRLQEQARAGQVFTDEAMITVLGDAADARALGTIQLRGRRGQTTVYELTALR